MKASRCELFKGTETQMEIGDESITLYRSNVDAMCYFGSVHLTCVLEANLCDNGFFRSELSLSREDERERGLTGWTAALDWELARSDSLAARKELVTGFKVPSDLLQLKSGHSESLDFTHLFFVLRYTF